MARWLAAHADKVDALAWRARPVGPAHPVLDRACAADPVVDRPGLSLERAERAGARRAASRSRRGQGAAGRAADRGVVRRGRGGAADPRRRSAPRVRRGGAGARARRPALFDDGGAVSRSPAMLLDTVMLLAMLRETYAARRLDLPERGRRRRWRGWCRRCSASTHGDRGLSSWQGGGPATADAIAAVIEASGVRTRPLRQARDWGYQRLAAGHRGADRRRRAAAGRARWSRAAAPRRWRSNCPTARRG